MTHKDLNDLAQMMAQDAICCYPEDPPDFAATREFVSEFWYEDGDVNRERSEARFTAIEADPVSLGYLRGCFERAVRNAAKG